MDSLEDYFDFEFRQDKAELDHIDWLFSHILPSYKRFLDKDKGWPYSVDPAEKNYRKPKSFSSSTNGMILFALKCHAGSLASSVLFPYLQGRIITTDEFGSDWSTIMDECLKAFAAQLEGNSADELVKSETYGINDPFTLTWLLEISPISESKDVLRNTVTAAIHVVKEGFSNPDKPFFWQKSASEDTEATHVFPVLRAIHLFTVLEQQFRASVEASPVKVDFEFARASLKGTVRSYLMQRVHEHLSFASIQDSAFDPAELVFALEGLLLADGQSRSVDRFLMERVFLVLAEAQEGGYWRPTKPFVTGVKGLELKPLSVEIANSLLRIAHYLERDHRYDAALVKLLPLFRNYASWLYARLMRGEGVDKDGKPAPFAGWNSKDGRTATRIHLWETAHVVLFLLGYQFMLQKHIARVCVSKSALSIKALSRKAADAQLTPTMYWKKYCEPGEPFDVPDSRYAVYRRIRVMFLDSREQPKENKQIAYSMLLYGPPGTGKTRIANELAKALQWPLITITPSDFISKGESGIELRAKVIFKTLEEQRNVVILFDEIDRLILDRDSEFYRAQSDTFQLMTPSMLVKLNDLRQRHRSIFISSTQIAGEAKERLHQTEPAIREGLAHLRQAVRFGETDWHN